MNTLSPPKIEVNKVSLATERTPASSKYAVNWTRQGGAVLAVALAVVLGLTIARGQWLLLGGLVGMGLTLLWPISITLGAFAFLVPFDVVSVIGNGREGTTLTFLAGAAAGLALLGTGLFRRRFERPLPVALWWFLYILGAAQQFCGPMILCARWPAYPAR